MELCDLILVSKTYGFVNEALTEARGCVVVGWFYMHRKVSEIVPTIMRQSGLVQFDKFDSENISSTV